MSEDYYRGQFKWFTGVVEDIQDPEEMGRVRVRCFGYHTENTTLIPTADLPWASVMTPATSASMSGIGQSATGILQGSWVVGFFRDGSSCQDPVVMGTIPTMQSKKDENSSRGFKDPSNRYPLYTGAPDMPDESRSSYKDSYAYTAKDSLKNSYKNIATANNGPKWSMTPCSETIRTVYPANHTTAFEEDANVIEYDSTTDAHRYSHVGPNKTFTEIDSTGTVSQVITNKRFTVIVSDDNVNVKGDCNLTIDGNCRTKIEKDWHIEVGGNKKEVVKGNVDETYSGNQTTDVKGNIDIDATRIDLN